MKLPKCMYKRRNAFYFRVKKRGKETWVPLGSEFETACRRLRELRKRDVPITGNTTLVQIAQKWLKVYVPTARNEPGQRLAAVRVEKYLRPFFGSTPATRVSGDSVREYRLWLEEQTGRQTVSHVLSDIRCVLNWATDSGYLSASPFPRRVMPRIQERPPDRLTDDEVDKLLEIPEPWRYTVRLALATGLRWSELTRAKTSDVADGMLTVHQTKSGRVRRVPIAADLVIGRVGLLIGFRDASVFSRKVRRLSGVERFHPHQLRHTFACRWLERGGSLHALQQILGHASVVTTQRYARLTDEMVQREARRIGGNESGNAVS